MGVRVSPSAPAAIAPRSRARERNARLRREGTGLPDTPGSRDIDLAVLAHLRGYPDELRRFSNLMKQVHSQGRSAAAFFLDRAVAEDSFVAALARLIQAGEDVVTVVEAAEILGVSPAALLEPARLSALPPPLAGDGRHRIWRRADIVRYRQDPERRPGG